MEGTKVEFEGAPCLQHSNYVFYKAFKYKSGEHYKMLALGDFFFLKILQEIPVCIGEIELLWEDKASNQLLASLRLYFRPEHTPDGRQDDTGEDEVVALGERIVLRLDDLIPLIQQDCKWLYGSSTTCTTSNEKKQPSKEAVSPGKNTTSTKDGSNAKDTGGSKPSQEGGDSHYNSGCDDMKNALVMASENGKKRNCSVTLVKLEHSDVEFGRCGLEDVKMPTSHGKAKTISGAANIAVLSYPRYCRYRAMRKRLEGVENEWIHVAVVVAIGGYSGRGPGCQVMFCRDTFYQSEIDDLDIRMDHMLPILKGRSKGKKIKSLVRKDSQQDSDSMEEMFANIIPTISSSSRPRRSTESSDINEDKVSTEEQAFLIGLHKFMHDAKMPIGRIPSLGFKQIDLFYFFKQAEKLGGYDAITHKRMWKHLYDKLGGNSSNTSAATCTRKHYERLLLPYERHLRKMKVGKPKKRHRKFGEHLDNVKVEGLDRNGHLSQKENVEVKVEMKKEMKKEAEVKLETVVSSPKEDVKMNFTDNGNESGNQKDKMAPGMAEHSKQDFFGDSEVLEIPLIRHRVLGSNAFSPGDLKSLERQKLSLSSALAGGPGSVMPGENTPISYANMVYGGGYMMPVLPPHLLQAQWGMLPTPTGPPPSSHARTTPSELSAKDSSKSPLPSTSKTNQSLDPSTSSNQNNRSKPASSKVPHSAQSHLQPSASSSRSVKAAHTNTPYKPTPYLLSDHIQTGRKSSSLHFGPNDLLSNPSHNLAPILHPRPPGHEYHLFLPPAPLALYLHPSCSNPFSPLPSPITSSPPVAHNQPRKRPYPFDSPSTPSSVSVFPSPDMVLDRIKSSTGLPCSNAAPSSIKQRFENPRDIFKQTPPSTASSHNPATPQKGQIHSQKPEFPNSKQLNTKSKSVSKKSQPPFSPYSQMSALELQQSLMQQNNILLSGNSKVMDQVKNSGNSNGFLSAQPASKSMPVIQQSSPVPSSSKDGRLTSALFGTQFTALPRSTKPSDSPSQQSFLSDTSSAAMSLNAHLHPAFMSPFLPSGASPAPPVLNPQLQMLASAYGTTPGQLAAYEEMLRQNGYGAMLPAATQQSKGAKRN